MASYTLEQIRALPIVDFFKYGFELDATGFLLPLVDAMNKQASKKTPAEIGLIVSAMKAAKEGGKVRM